MKRSKIKKIIKSTESKIVILVIMTITLVAFFFAANSQFKSQEHPTNIKSIKLDATQEYATSTVNIDVGLLIKNFSYFSLIENKVIADMVVWFKFSPEEVTLETIEKFSFENGKILKKDPPDIITAGNKKIAKYNVLAELSSNLSYHNFPLEDHKFSIHVTNNFVTPYELVFNVLNTNFVVSPDVFVSNWRMTNLSTTFGVDEDQLNQLDKEKKVAHPIAVFTIHFEKTGLRRAYIIFIPIFLAFLFALLSLLISIQQAPVRIRLTATSVGALLTYRFVIERMMPSVGYFTIADYIYGVLITGAFVILLLNIVLSKIFYDYSEKLKPDPQKVMTLVNKLTLTKDISFIIISVVTTTLIWYILFK